MQLTYTPEDGDPQVFDFHVERLMSFEAEALEEAGGEQWETVHEWANKFDRGSMRAIRAALWIMLRRQQPTLRFSDLVVRVNELKMEEDLEPEQGPGKDEPGDSSTDSPSPPPDSEPSPNNSAGT
jgi:hypothetical protein